MIKIFAFKPSPGTPGYLSACELEDPDADTFQISYPNMYLGMSLDVCKTLYQAESVAAALGRVFEAGRSAKAIRIRNSAIMPAQSRYPWGKTGSFSARNASMRTSLRFRNDGFSGRYLCPDM